MVFRKAVLVMVFEHERAAYEGWITSLTAEGLRPFADEYVQIDDQWETIEGWRAQFFADAGEGLGDELSFNLFHLARHLAYHDGKAPPFFAFDERNHHDLDQIAAKLIDQPLSPRDKAAALQAEYQRSDRYWSVFYPNFLFFKSQYDACENRLLMGEQLSAKPVFETPEEHRDREPSQEIKDQVLERDGYRCLSCGEDTRRWLQIDHVAPYYLGGLNSLGNLQTLCRICNGHKGISEINFRHNETMLSQPPAQFPVLDRPSLEMASSPEAWRRFLRRSVNFFYRCAAVADVNVDDALEGTWSIRLWANNNPQWLEPFLSTLLQQIQARRFEGGATRPAELTVGAPNQAALRMAAPAPTSQPPLEAQTSLAVATAKQHTLVFPTSSLPAIKTGAALRALPNTSASRVGSPTAAALVPSGTYIVAVTTAGKAYLLPRPEGSQPGAYAITDIAGLERGEKICVLTALPQNSPDLYAVLVTSTGYAKRLALNEFIPTVSRGRTIITGGEVAAVGYASLEDDLLLATYGGYAIRIRIAELPEQRANAGGVRAIRLWEGDAVVALTVAHGGANTGDLVVVTESGQAKRTPLAEYRIQGRDGGGLHTSSVGGLISAFLAETGDEVLLLSQKGKVARLPVADIPRQRRDTAGSYLVTLDNGDQVISAQALPAERR